MARGSRLNAVGDLRRRADDWWLTHAGQDGKSTVTAVLVKGDGSIVFEWDDASESGAYGIPLEQLFRETLP